MYWGQHTPPPLSIGLSLFEQGGSSRELGNQQNLWRTRSYCIRSVDLGHHLCSINPQNQHRGNNWSSTCCLGSVLIRDRECAWGTCQFSWGRSHGTSLGSVCILHIGEWQRKYLDGCVPDTIAFLSHLDCWYFHWLFLHRYPFPKLLCRRACWQV